MIQALRPLAQAALNVGRRMAGPRTATLADLARIRRAMGEQVLDCELKVARRVRTQLDSAATVLQLWLLRSEIYQAVSDQFGQHEAMRRVKRLKPLFEGLLPERQLK
ncbi:hypothetical protein [Ottowia testudinis]|uniref:Uncharacterized protein n=1 Tax=Ottowia testudinis TaxID=2816950 RepID=A0A975CDV8_9BURK|nr:hypothetical protein [Ottowia testudinis]QTD44633.1 hypothetical protein J1M35_16300 [Ottowia testudinis]